MFNIISGINESKKLTKHISCEYKCIFEGRKRNSYQWWNNDKCRCECKKGHVCEKGYTWNPATCNCENGKYLASVMDDSAFICDKVINADAKLSAKNDDETNFNEKKATCKMQNFYILLAFLLITIALLIAVSVYCYLTKYRGKQLLPFHCTNYQLR